MKHFLRIPVQSCSILLWEPRLQHYNRMKFAYKRKFRWSGITLRNLLCTDFSITPISFLMHALTQYAQVGVCWTVSFGDTTSSDWVKLEALNSVPLLAVCRTCCDLSDAKSNNVQSTFQSLIISYLSNLVRTHPNTIFNLHNAAFTQAQLIL